MATAEQIRAAAAASVAASAVVAAPNTVDAAPGTPGANGPNTTDKVAAAPLLPEAVGTVNPDASDKDKIAALQAQLAQALGIIATISPAAVAAVEGERTYHSSVPFVKIQVMKGPGICEGWQFKGGKLTTDDPRVIAFMEAAISSGNTMFSHAPIDSTKKSAEELEMEKDVLTSAVIARDKMVKAGEKVA